MESAAAFVSHSGAFRRQAGFPILTPDELGQIDLGNKSSLNRVVWIVCPVVISLVSVVVALRLIVRRRTTGRLFLDDGGSRSPSSPVRRRTADGRVGACQVSWCWQRYLPWSCAP